MKKKAPYWVTPAQENKVTGYALQISILLWIGQVLTIVFSWRFLPSQVPLLYSRPWGEKQLIDPTGLLILPALSLIIFLANSILSGLLFKKEALLSQILAVSVTIFNLLCLVTLIQIIRLVT